MLKKLSERKWPTGTLLKLSLSIVTVHISRFLEKATYAVCGVLKSLGFSLVNCVSLGVFQSQGPSSSVLSMELTLRVFTRFVKFDRRYEEQSHVSCLFVLVGSGWATWWSLSTSRRANFWTGFCKSLETLSPGSKVLPSDSPTLLPPPNALKRWGC